MNLKPPSLQHIARFYKPTPIEVKKELVSLANSRPPFSYESLYAMVWDMVAIKSPFENIRKAVERIPLQVRRESYLRALPPTEKFVRSYERTYEVQIEPRSYSIGRGLRVPFAPPMLFGTSSGPVLPWFIFWRKNPMTDLQISLLVSMAHDVFDQDSEFEDAKLLIVDTSTKALDVKGMPRLTDSTTIPRLSSQDMLSMLEVVAEGFNLAKEHLANIEPRKERKKESELDQDQDPSQIMMFD